LQTVSTVYTTKTGASLKSESPQLHELVHCKGRAKTGEKIGVQYGSTPFIYRFREGL